MNMKLFFFKKFLSIIIFLGLCIQVTSQVDKSAIFTFNDCSGINSGDFGGDAEPMGDAGCECGVSGNSVSLDGNNDRIALPDTLREIFDDDFTVSFYFSTRNTMGTVDIFSYRSSCNADSAMSIRYVPMTNELRVELVKDFNNLINLQAYLDQSKCWHQVVVTKFELNYSLYLDGQLVDNVLADEQIRFGKEAKIWIANSPCLAFTEERIEGEIDELELHNFAFSPFDVVDFNLLPDRILTGDTTIFIGEQLQLELGPTCAGNISWSPSAGLDAVDVADPIVTGITSTDYIVELNNNTCISRDTVRVNVVDPEALQCDDLLLPKAFTPNNDGLNDLYGISNDFIVQELVSFEIFDRWGELIFSTLNKNDGWDGYFKGQPVNPGMYLYKIKYICENEEYISLDNFTVLR